MNNENKGDYISFENGSLTFSNTTGLNVNVNGTTITPLMGSTTEGCFVSPTIYPWYGYWNNYYSYPVYITEKSKFEQSFKIVSKLMEKKIIKQTLSVKEFIELVNDIAGVI